MAHRARAPQGSANARTLPRPRIWVGEHLNHRPGLHTRFAGVTNVFDDSKVAVSCVSFGTLRNDLLAFANVEGELWFVTLHAAEPPHVLQVLLAGHRGGGRGGEVPGGHGAAASVSIRLHGL